MTSPGQILGEGRWGKSLLMSCLVWVLFVGWPSIAMAAEVIKFDFESNAIRARLEKPAKVIEVELPATTQVPVIDGEINDPAWSHAWELKDWTGTQFPTRVLLMADAQTFYVAFVCGHPESIPPVAQVRARDAEVHKDDCVELWIGNGRAGRVAADFHFVINAAGSILDARGKDVSYSPAWSVAVQKQKNQWVAEMAIPLQALGITNALGLSLPFNLGRNGPAVSAKSWNGTYGVTSGARLKFPGVPGLPGAGVSKEAAEADDSDAADVNVAADPNASLRVLRGATRLDAGERWARVELAIAPSAGALEGLSLGAELFAPGQSKPLAQQQSATLSHRKPLVWVDVRTPGLSTGRLALTLKRGPQVLGVIEQTLTAKSAPPALSGDQRIAIQLNMPDGADASQLVPVTFGVPMPLGGLWDASVLQLVDARGQPIAFQSEVTGRWAKEGSIQWVRFDALVRPADGCFVVARASKPAQPASPALTLDKRGSEIVINTGPAQFTLGAAGSPIRAVTLQGKKIATVEGARGLYVIDQNNHMATASEKDATVQIEASGPVAACVRIEGPYVDESGKTAARHITRVEAFAGQTQARVTHTLVLIHDTNQVWFKEVGWEIKTDLGPQPVAIFNNDRDNFASYTEQPITGAIREAYMLQDRHMQFKKGENRFTVATVGGDGASHPVTQGKECGDWSALRGSQGTLVLACQDAARQHPKEFTLSASTISLKLFSNRAGDELDFRMASMMPRWNLEAWHAAGGIPKANIPGALDRIAKAPSNAIGWSKTHTLMLGVLPSTADVVKAAANLGHLNSKPVLAIADPWWTYQSDVFGPLYPRDTQRFPDIERVIHDTAQWWHERIAALGEYGFVDYYAGPHLRYRPDLGFFNMVRYSITYSLRSDLWMLYARSGDRELFDFASRANRTFMDGYMCRWPGNGKIRGAYIYQSGTPNWTNGDSPESLPMYWQGGPSFGVGGSTNLDQFEWFYQLTGDRRAREAVTEYAQAVKENIDAERARREWRPLRLLLTVSQCYAVTGDEHFRVLADVLTEFLYQPRSQIKLTPDKPYGSTYKTQSDTWPVWQASRILRDPRVNEILGALAIHWNNQYLASHPVAYCHPMGIVGQVLDERTHDPAIPTGQWLMLRRTVPTFDFKTKSFPDSMQIAPAMQGVFQSLPYAMALVARRNADRRPLASWASIDVTSDEPMSVLVRKEQGQRLVIHIRGRDAQDGQGQVRSRLEVREITGAKAHFFTQMLNQIVQTSGKSSLITLPLDAPGGIYQISGFPKGINTVIADAATPMVVLAPQGIVVAPVLAPAAKLFFRIPEGKADVSLELEQPALLFTPAGAAYGEGKPVTGKIALPATQPGLWSVQAVNQPGKIRLNGATPAFAFDDPQFHFDPPAQIAPLKPVEDDAE